MPEAISAFGYNTIVQPIISSANLITGLTLAGAAGTSGQVLTSAGSGLPTWSTAAALTLGTPVNVSGTSVTFTGIPAGTKQIVMTFNGVSNTDEWLIQLGDSGGIETSNYVTVSASLQSGSTVQTSSSLIGFIVKTNNELVFSGTMTWTLLNSATFLWAGSGGLGSDTATGNMNITSSGKKALSAELTQIRLTTVNGTDSFSAGSINIAYI